MFKNLIKWSDSDHAELPWRKKRTLYGTLVSEIMLQQTTVGTVLSHFDRFLKLYPTPYDLAQSTEEEVCIAWKGLGYYRRARNLRKAAIDIVENFDGEIPLDYEKLISISGVGEYTANAILSIGADHKALAIDANIERVVSRLYGIKEKKGPKLQKMIKALFEEGKVLKDIDKVGARKLNEALMDLGRVYCQARKANCLNCPMNKKCLAKESGEPLSYPIQEEKKQKFFELELLRVVVKKRNKILGYVKSDDQWLSGQIELPTFILKSEDKKISQYPILKKKINVDKLKKYKTTITKYKIVNYIYEIDQDEFDKKFSNLLDVQLFNNDSEKTNLSTASIKALSLI
ncbi:hypothetical protein HBN50_14905 [Halobacteriovorax sp. GB3]|uniref:A/G-specific adenine glycosylase n=1 Tax=Halobacteriovorax sp. GB3 TaxID=2719615 RepID=UPI002361420B|nr:hypothetical protein [Halobacteriovorax sp. GB3]MDD0854399.1 hypothetical protein [Halobacteriovorax sp. GB3]